MSNKYKFGDKVPSDVLCNRLDELANAVTKGRDGINREFYMSVPAELDHDADLVISEASRRIDDLSKQVEKWKQVAEDAAIANTKAEACGIVETALNDNGA